MARVAWCDSPKRPMSRPKRLHMQPQTVVHPGPRFRPRLVRAHDQSSDAGTSPGEAGRILIVEDDYLISADMEMELSAAGFEVVGVATSAQEAIDAARQRKPD